MEIKRKNLAISLVLVLGLILFFAAGYFIGERSGFEKGWTNGEHQGYEQGLKAQEASCALDPSAAVQNPMDNMPTANPFEESVNPFK